MIISSQYQPSGPNNERTNSKMPKPEPKSEQPAPMQQSIPMPAIPLLQTNLLECTLKRDFLAEDIDEACVSCELMLDGYSDLWVANKLYGHWNGNRCNSILLSQHVSHLQMTYDLSSSVIDISFCLSRYKVSSAEMQDALASTWDIVGVNFAVHLNRCDDKTNFVDRLGEALRNKVEPNRQPDDHLYGIECNTSGLRVSFVSEAPDHLGLKWPGKLMVVFDVHALKSADEHDVLHEDVKDLALVEHTTRALNWPEEWNQSPPKDASVNPFRTLDDPTVMFNATPEAKRKRLEQYWAQHPAVRDIFFSSSNGVLSSRNGKEENVC